ncbi:MAG TPA: hypothetical protein VFA43_00295 [Gemmatimonadaceae bacterium]|nr:hypothetical protein [Gemmatimonadaceae bacterium]
MRRASKPPPLEAFAQVEKIGSTITYIGSAALAEELPPRAHRVICTDRYDEMYLGDTISKNELKKFVLLADEINAHRLADVREQQQGGARVARDTKVYVNCKHGRVRSVITTGIFLMKYGGRSVDEAMTSLRAARGAEWAESDDGFKVRGWLQGFADQQ